LSNVCAASEGLIPMALTDTIVALLPHFHAPDVICRHGGTGVPPVNHAQDARATSKLTRSLVSESNFIVKSTTMPVRED
jgi:hypothetical protein